MRRLIALSVVPLAFALLVGVAPGADDPVVEATWELQVAGKDKSVVKSAIKLYSNGHINDADGKNTWVKKDHTLTLRWVNPKAPGGAWVDTCKVSADGKTFAGRNQVGAVLAGKLVGDAPAGPAAARKEPPAQGAGPTPAGVAATPTFEADRDGLEFPPVGPVKAAAADRAGDDSKTARAAHQDALKKARTDLRKDWMALRAGLKGDAAKAREAGDLEHQFMLFACGPGRSQDTGPLPTHPLAAAVVADYWAKVDGSTRKFGEAAAKSLEAYKQGGATDPARLHPLEAAKLAGEHAEFVGVWSSASVEQASMTPSGPGIQTRDVWAVSTDAGTGGWRVVGEFNHKDGHVGQVLSAETATLAVDRLTLRIPLTAGPQVAPPPGKPKPASPAMTVTLKLVKGKMQFEAVNGLGVKVVKALYRSGDEHARDSIAPYGVRGATPPGEAAAGKPDPDDADAVWHQIAMFNSFPAHRGKGGPAGGEQFFLPWRSGRPTVTPGAYGGLTDMLLGRAPGGGKNQQYIELTFKQFDQWAATPHPYLRRAGAEFLALDRARFQLAEADELLGNTPNSSIREFQQKVSLPAAQYVFQRDKDRAELEARLNRENADPRVRFVVTDAPLTEASRKHLDDLIGGASGLVEDVKNRSVVSGLLAYADMAQVDRHTRLWQTWLLPLAKKCGGPPATAPLLDVSGDWKVQLASRERFMRLNEFHLKNVAGKELTSVTVELLVENEWGDKAAQYYFFDRVEAAETVRLTPHPRWAKRVLPYTNAAKVAWSVWSDQATETGRAKSLANPTPIPDAAGARGDFRKYDQQYRPEGEALGAVVRTFPLLPVVPERQRRALLLAAASKATFAVQAPGKEKLLTVRFRNPDAAKGTIEWEVNDLVGQKPYLAATPVWRGRLEPDPDAGYAIHFDTGWTLTLSPDDQLVVSTQKGKPATSPLLRLAAK